MKEIMMRIEGKKCTGDVVSQEYITRVMYVDKERNMEVLRWP